MQNTLGTWEQDLETSLILENWELHRGGNIWAVSWRMDSSLPDEESRKCNFWPMGNQSRSRALEKSAFVLPTTTPSEFSTPPSPPGSEGAPPFFRAELHIHLAVPKLQKCVLIPLRDSSEGCKVLQSFSWWYELLWGVYLFFVQPWWYPTFGGCTGPHPPTVAGEECVP